jgi:putative inorganic carbon (HCO3(-)) transporter
MLRSFFIFAILVPSVVFALTDRYKALLLYLWWAFFRPQEWVWFDISGLRMSLVLGLILVVPAFVTATFPNLTHLLSIGTVLFLVSGLLAQTNAINAPVGWLWVDFFTRLTLVCLIGVTLIKTPRDLMRVMAVVAGSLGFFAAKAGFVSLTHGGMRFYTGLSGAFMDNTGYALGTVMTMPLLVALAQNIDVTFEGLIPKWLITTGKWICYVAVPLCAYTVISSFARGGFLALVGAVVVYVALHPRRVRLALTLIVLVPLALRFVPLPAGYLDRIDTIPLEEAVADTPTDDSEDASSPLEDTAEGRLHFWRVAMNMVTAHPLGIGMRNFESTYNDYDFMHGRYGRRRAVHSSHFQVLAEMGYLGAFVWVSMFAYAFWIGLVVRGRSRTPGLSPPNARFMFTVATALIASMTGFVVGGSFISLALNDLTWVTFAMMAALDRMSARLCEEAKAVVAQPKWSATPDLRATDWSAPAPGIVARSIGQPRRS